MQKLHSIGRIYVSTSGIRHAGRGVFAGADIRKGEIIEQCPVIGIPDADAAHVSESLLATYIFYLGIKKDKPVLALGFGSLYNHSDYPNAKYAGCVREQRIDFIATRAIREGEEITVNYSPGRGEGSDPLWFTAEKTVRS